MSRATVFLKKKSEKARQKSDENRILAVFSDAFFSLVSDGKNTKNREFRSAFAIVECVFWIFPAISGRYSRNIAGKCFFLARFSLKIDSIMEFLYEIRCFWM
jgi:hypothetical protein